MIPTSLLSSPSAFCICMRVKNSKVASVLDLVCGQQCLGRGAGSVSVLNFVVKCIVWTKTEMRSKIRLLSHSKELEGIILLVGCTKCLRLPGSETSFPIYCSPIFF